MLIYYGIPHDLGLDYPTLRPVNPNKKRMNFTQKPPVDSWNLMGSRHVEGESTAELVTELKEAHRKINLDDIRINLMKELLGNGLCTRDIYSFACAQADLCVNIGDPDWTTIKSAMRTKIRDLKLNLKLNHRERRKNESKLLQMLGGDSWCVRKKIRQIKTSLGKEKKSLVEKYKNKLERYRTKMDRLKTDSNVIRTEATVIPTIPPKNLQEFSTTSIFNSPEDFARPQPPLGPFVTCKSIKLSKGELKLLSRDPKYSVIYPPYKYEGCH